MTFGHPARLALSFALPLMLGNIAQQLYTITDAAIIGQFAGIEAFSALGSAEWMVWMVFGVISSVMQGFGIPMAQLFGAGDLRHLRRTVRTAALIALIIALGYTALGLSTALPLLRLLGTIENLRSRALTYLMIVISGTLFTTIYNLSATVLRALGNSRAPLIAMAVSSVMNIVLDLLFVWGFKWSIADAAAATVFSQLAASLVCLWQVRKLDILKSDDDEKAAERFSRKDAGTLLRLAAPMALQSVLIGLGGMALQSVINSLGESFVAGFSAGNKLYGVLEMAAVAFGMAVVTYTGQNLGAKQFSRIRLGIRWFAPLGVLMSLVITAIMFIFGRDFLRLFIEKGAPEDAMKVAVRYIRTMAASLSTLYLLYIYRSALQGIGNTFIPMVSGLAECVARVGMAVLLTHTVGSSGIYWVETAAWSAAMILLIIAWYIKQRQLESLKLQ